MSEQSKILEEMQALIMNIIERGSASDIEADKMDELEELLFEQNCFKNVGDLENSYQGEEIANLFFSGNDTAAIEKMRSYEVTPEDFFGFINYHYDDDHVDEEKIQIFTSQFIAKVEEVF